MDFFRRLKRKMEIGLLWFIGWVVVCGVLQICKPLAKVKTNELRCECK
jgi:hypothetical protein